MNIAKNMEFVFVIAVALSCASAFAAPVARVDSTPAASNAKMQTVYVSAKRLTAAQKARLGA